MAHHGKAPLAAVAWWGSRIASWLVLLAAVAVLLAMVVVPRLAGATAYTVLTGSMEPGLPPGELVIMKPIDPARITVGEVVTYQRESGRPEVVTHRVAGVSVSGAGDRSFTFRGDANSANDPNPVRPEQIKGVLWYHLPLLGFVNIWLTGEWRAVGIGVAAGALLLYAAVVWAQALRDRTRGRGPRSRTPEPTEGTTDAHPQLPRQPRPVGGSGRPSRHGA